MRTLNNVHRVRMELTVVAIQKVAHRAYQEVILEKERWNVMTVMKRRRIPVNYIWLQDSDLTLYVDDLTN